MIGRILRSLFVDDPFYECRSCGKTLESAEGPCPACESDHIAEYEWR